VARGSGGQSQDFFVVILQRQAQNSGGSTGYASAIVAIHTVYIHTFFKKRKKK
jgi:hypothetical protein